MAVAAFAKSNFLKAELVRLRYSGKNVPPPGVANIPDVSHTRKDQIKSRFIGGVVGAYFVTGAIPDDPRAKDHTFLQLFRTDLLFRRKRLGIYSRIREHRDKHSRRCRVLFTFGYFLLWRPRRASILEAVVCLYMLVFAFTCWETQFLVNLIPLLTVFYFTSGNKKWPFLAYMSSALAFVLLDFGFYWTSWGHAFFFIPNYNQVLQHYSDLLLFIRQWPIGGEDVNTFITTPIRSIFVAISLYYSPWIFLRNIDKQILRRIL